MRGVFFILAMLGSREEKDTILVEYKYSCDCIEVEVYIAQPKTERIIGAFIYLIGSQI